MRLVPSSLTRALAKLRMANAAANENWSEHQFDLREACYAFVAEFCDLGATAEQELVCRAKLIETMIGTATSYAARNDGLNKRCRKVIAENAPNASASFRDVCDDALEVGFSGAEENLWTTPLRTKLQKLEYVRRRVGAIAHELSIKNKTQPKKSKKSSNELDALIDLQREIDELEAETREVLIRADRVQADGCWGLH